MERNSGNMQYEPSGSGEFYVNAEGELVPVPVTAAGNPNHGSNGRFVSGPGGKIFSKDARGQLSEVAGTAGKGLKVIGGEIHQPVKGESGTYIPITGPKSTAVKDAKTRADVLYNRQVALESALASAVKGRKVVNGDASFEWSDNGTLGSDRGISGDVQSVPGKGSAGSYKATVRYEFAPKEYSKTFDASKVKDAVSFVEKEAASGLSRIINGEGSKDW